MQKTCVYVDGFNLYYRAIAEDNPDCKWLDLLKLSTRLLPDNDVQKILYFSAKVKGNEDKRTRQEVYWRALRTIPNLEIIEGKFSRHKVKRELVAPICGHTEARVYKVEEKGSDVNLAVHLIRGACDNEYDVATIISNDSDLLLAVEMVQSHFGKDVVMLNPQSGSKKGQLRQTANHVRMINRPHLLQSQFPDTLTDRKGTFYKPRGW